MVPDMKERDILVGLGGRIRVFRKAAGLNQAELAEKVGVTLETIGRIERGIHFASAANLGRIAQAVGRDIDELFQDTPRVKKKPEQVAIDQAVSQFRAMLEGGQTIDVEDLAAVFDRAAKKQPKTAKKR
jgi:transcriptional regulator with XRE-family HTH domain